MTVLPRRFQVSDNQFRHKSAVEGAAQMARLAAGKPTVAVYGIFEVMRRSNTLRLTRMSMNMFSQCSILFRAGDNVSEPRRA